MICEKWLKSANWLLIVLFLKAEVFTLTFILMTLPRQAFVTQSNEIFAAQFPTTRIKHSLQVCVILSLNFLGHLLKVTSDTLQSWGQAVAQAINEQNFKYGRGVMECPPAPVFRRWKPSQLGQRRVAFQGNCEASVSGATSHLMWNSFHLPSTLLWKPGGFLRGAEILSHCNEAAFF